MSKQVLLPVVPVVVNDCYNTFALLDSASTNSFCSQELVNTLNIKGNKTVLNLSTLEKSSSERVTEAVSFSLRGGDEMFQMSNVYVIESVPVPIVENYAASSCEHLRGIQPPLADKVDILIGQDCPEVLIPHEVRRDAKNEPYAIRTCLGWSVCGPLGGSDKANGKTFANFIKIDKQVEQMWQLDNELLSEERTMSLQDQAVITLWEEKGKLINGHYELPIPWMRKVNDERRPNMANNKDQAVERFHGLKRRLEKDMTLKEGYTQGIKMLLDKGYAEPVPTTELCRNDGQVFYLPHHPVQSATKNKIRIVFDCSAQYRGLSLNDKVLQGPDLTNRLTSVLLRFRENEVAVAGDIEAMYHQVCVPVHDRDALRFLWPRDDNLDSDLLEYRMTVHLFGGVWSSSAANYALRKTADDIRSKYPVEVSESVTSNFYVDDWLKSTHTTAQAIELINDIRSLLRQGGFNLTKFSSADRQVLKSIPAEHRGKQIENIDLDKQELPQDRALGVKWNTNTDSFYFKPKMLVRPHTRRGIILGVYDPLGLVCPVVIIGKMIFQELTRLGLGWDEPIPQHLEAKWIRWMKDLPMLEKMYIPRCIKPTALKEPAIVQLHHFCDASLSAYGEVTYVRVIDCIHVALLLAKSRLAHVKTMTIPRLEQTAAVLAAKIDASLKTQLEMHVDESFFWSDSQLTIQYIQNSRKRFHVFVANRIAVIQQASKPHQWRYISSHDNPADCLTRGLSPSEIADSHWIHGPSFLKKPQHEWSLTEITDDLPASDSEIKPDATTHMIKTEDSYIDGLMNQCPSLYKLKKAVAGQLLNSRSKDDPSIESEITVELLQQAEQEIVKHVQRSSMSEEYEALKRKKPVRKLSHIYKLSPILSDDIICIGGRLNNSDMPGITKHQIILPKDHALLADNSRGPR